MSVRHQALDAAARLRTIARELRPPALEFGRVRALSSLDAEIEVTSAPGKATAVEATIPFNGALRAHRERPGRKTRSAPGPLTATGLIGRRIRPAGDGRETGADRPPAHRPPTPWPARRNPRSYRRGHPHLCREAPIPGLGVRHKPAQVLSRNPARPFLRFRWRAIALRPCPSGVCGQTGDRGAAPHRHLAHSPQ